MIACGVNYIQLYLLEAVVELQFACYLVQPTDSEISVSLLRQHQHWSEHPNSSLSHLQWVLGLSYCGLYSILRRVSKIYRIQTSSGENTIVPRVTEITDSASMVVQFMKLKDRLWITAYDTMRWFTYTGNDHDYAVLLAYRNVLRRNATVINFSTICVGWLCYSLIYYSFVSLWKNLKFNLPFAWSKTGISNNRLTRFKSRWFSSIVLSSQPRDLEMGSFIS